MNKPSVVLKKGVVRRSKDRWRIYESAKAAYIQDNPGATPAEYEKAIRDIAERCGV